MLHFLFTYLSYLQNSFLQICDFSEGGFFLDMYFGEEVISGVMIFFGQVILEPMIFGVCDFWEFLVEGVFFLESFLVKVIFSVDGFECDSDST